MVTREVRIAEFTTGKQPESNVALELLCQDHNGTYTLPFPCRRIDHEWRNQVTGEVIAAEILGWRIWNPR